MLVKSFLKRHLPESTKRWLLQKYALHIAKFARKSYAQHGEDLILQELFPSNNQGFYIDVGAHHPFRFSNTYLLYTKGWRGINIDAMPGSMKLFNKFRARDINLECGVAKRAGTLLYYAFNEPALNGFSPCLEHAHKNSSTYHIVDRIHIPVRRLESILDDYLAPHTPIDLLSIDCEGFDLEVLESNNWEKYRPKVVVVECWDNDIDTISQQPITLLLQSKDYKLSSKMFNTLIFESMASI